MRATPQTHQEAALRTLEAVGGTKGGGAGVACALQGWSLLAPGDLCACGGVVALPGLVRVLCFSEFKALFAHRTVHAGHVFCVFVHTGVSELASVEETEALATLIAGKWQEVLRRKQQTENTSMYVSMRAQCVNAHEDITIKLV
jgi:hypothetical protein